MNTTIENSGGWKAKTTLDLSEYHVLVINTYKGRHGMLMTYATRHTKEGPGLVHTLFKDFNLRVLAVKTRATKKAVETQHQSALDQLDDIIAKCEAHYDQTAQEG